MESNGRAPRLERHVAADSQILTVGGTWRRRAAFVEAPGQTRLWRATQITVPIHDLSQTKLPELYPNTSATFERNAKQFLHVADRIMVYSEATRADVADLLAETGPFKPIAKFWMGSIMVAAPVPGSEPRTVPFGLEMCVGRPVVLHVSSIEPRKNHRMLVEVWRRLIEARGDSIPMLLCVERPVMDGQLLIEEVQADQILKRHVHFAMGLNNDALDWCYRNAAFTVYPSLYEGWGLPIAESLLYGKLCITSNASSMREVARELRDLLDPADVVA